MSLNVLIVDDSPVMRGVIRRVLNLADIDLGCCFEASDGCEALAYLDRECIDVVLTDINMPRMNGEQLLCEMRRRGLLSRLRTLVVSTDATKQRIRRVFLLGASGYLSKPFSPEELRAKLYAILDERPNVV